MFIIKIIDYSILNSSNFPLFILTNYLFYINSIYMSYRDCDSGVLYVSLSTVWTSLLLYLVVGFDLWIMRDITCDTTTVLGGSPNSVGRVVDGPLTDDYRVSFYEGTLNRIDVPRRRVFSAEEGPPSGIGFWRVTSGVSGPGDRSWTSEIFPGRTEFSRDTLVDSGDNVSMS